MTAIIIFSTLLVGIISTLVSYIPKPWIEKHIVKVLDPDDTRF
jgi:hypothetical protein